MDGAENEYDRIAAELKEAEKVTGRQRAARMVARFGYALYAAAAVVLAFAIFTSFIGGSILIAGKQAAGGFVLAAGLAVGGYFMLVYGVVVSEIACWIGMCIVAVIVGVNIHSHVRAYLDTRNARRLITKRIAAGEIPADGFALLPVGIEQKKDLVLATRAEQGDVNAARDLALRLLEKFSIPAPAPKP